MNKTIKVGVPRALIYYEYYPLWRTFFEHLGAEVVLSKKSSKNIAKQGIQSSVSDACLPVKIFHGHTMELLGNVDYIFIPRLKSVYKNEYICPKITGLPEMIKFSVKKLPKIIDTEVFLRKSNRHLAKSFWDAGGYITSDKKAIKEAAKKAIDCHREYLGKMQKGKTPAEILEGFSLSKTKDTSLKVAVMGHSYNIYDSYISMDIMEKLSQKGIEVLTPELISPELISSYAQRLSKNMYWSLGKRQLASAMIWAENKEVDAVIFIMSFGCGIDSFVAELVERKIRESNIPFLLLVVDEHTGEAGMDTRLEAFIDMINWRKR